MPCRSSYPVIFKDYLCHGLLDSCRGWYKPGLSSGHRPPRGLSRGGPGWTPPAQGPADQLLPGHQGHRGAMVVHTSSGGEGLPCETVAKRTISLCL